MSPGESILRTPDDRFRDLAGYPFPPRYIDLGDARMYYVEQGRGQTVLCLHGDATWSYLYRKVIPELAWKHRVIAPDLIGFGRSDKYEDGRGYSLGRHVAQLADLVRRLDLTNITLVSHDLGATIALALLAEETGRFFRLVFLNPELPAEGTVQETEDANPREILSDVSAEARMAYEAPFPDRSYEAGLRSFRQILWSGAAELESARRALSEWFKPILVLVGNDKPKPGAPLPSGIPAIVVTEGGSLLPEHKGEEVADRIHSFMLRNPPPTQTKTFQPVPFW